MNIINKISTCPNFTLGRSGFKILGICNHITTDTASSALGWFQSKQAKVSCHYLVCEDGSIIQLVDESNQAWCQGIVNKPTAKIYFDNNCVNPNKYLIGIEHEGIDGTLTDVQYKATLELHLYLIQKYNIELDREHILGHYQLDSVDRPYCPGLNFPWTKLMQDTSPQPSIPQWEYDSCQFLVTKGFCGGLHQPREIITMELLAYMFNNYLFKLPSINPIQFLKDKGFLKSDHPISEQITWQTFGFMMNNKLNGSSTDPIKFLMDKGFITSTKNPSDIMNFALFGACMNNFISKGGKF